MVVQGDITQQRVDAVVNAANSGLAGGGGVDGAIHRAAGPAILQECREIISRKGRLPAGDAVITSGGKLPAKYIIHTVGPIWNGGHKDEPQTLSKCYISCLRIALNMNLTSIAFPAISTGAYGYPPDEAAKVAIGTTINFIRNTASNLTTVFFVVFDDSMRKIYSRELNAAIK